MKIENFDYFNNVNLKNSIHDSKNIDAIEFDIDFKTPEAKQDPTIGYSGDSCTAVCKSLEYHCLSFIELCKIDSYHERGVLSRDF